jgi:hypothetical protein
MTKEAQDSQGVDHYAAVLADLRAKRDEIDRAIKMIEGLASGGAVTVGIPGIQGNGMAAEEPGSFLGMTIADAAAKLLAIRKKALSNSDIVDAIRAGGVVLNSAQPINTVGTVLRRRQRDEGDIVRVGKMWGLAEWYPNAARFTRRGRK